RSGDVLPTGFRLSDSVHLGASPSARVLLQLLLAAQVRLPLAEHGWMAHRELQPGHFHGVVGCDSELYRYSHPYVFFREAVVLLLGLRMRRAGRDGRRSVPSPQ